MDAHNIPPFEFRSTVSLPTIFAANVTGSALDSSSFGQRFQVKSFGSTTALKVIFAGTPDFAIPSLEALLFSKHKINAVYTVPDRHSGRGLKLTPSPIKHFAMQNNLPVYQPANLTDENAQKFLHNLDADILIDVAYGLILPKEILTAFKFGCINLHPSLLPKWRGAAPIQRAILAGDEETGVTVMQVNEGLDTGDILQQEKVLIDKKDNSATLHAKLARIGASLLLETLEGLINDTIIPIPQDDFLSCYAKKITKEEGLIDWNLSAVELDRKVRAFNPWPVAFTTLSGNTVRIWQAEPLNKIIKNIPVGTILETSKNGIDVVTGSGVLRLLKLQLSGGKILSAAELLNAKREMFVKGLFNV